MNHADYMSNVFSYRFSHTWHTLKSYQTRRVLVIHIDGMWDHWAYHLLIIAMIAWWCFRQTAEQHGKGRAAFPAPEVSHTPAGWFASNFRVLSVRALALHWKSLGIELLSPSLAVTSSEGGWRKKGRQNASPLTSPLQTPRFLQYPAGSPSIQLSSDLPPPFTPTPA